MSRDLWRNGLHPRVRILLPKLGSRIMGGRELGVLLVILRRHKSTRNGAIRRRDRRRIILRFNHRRAHMTLRDWMINVRSWSWSRDTASIDRDLRDVLMR